MKSSSLWSEYAALASALLLTSLCAQAEIASILNPRTEGLPPGGLPTGPALGMPFAWIQTELLMAHLPPACHPEKPNDSSGCRCLPSHTDPNIAP